jgi:CPA1 family monovalent cation:H+ antiporter
MPYRQGLVALVFGCVLFSVVIQGLSIRPLLSRLGLTHRSERQREFEEALANVVTAQASSDTLDRMRDQHLLSKPIADRLQKRFEDRVEARSQQLFRMVMEEPGLAEANVRMMQREMANCQKQALVRLRRQGAISDEVYADFAGSIDEVLRNPATMDWVLAAELDPGSDELPPEPAAAGE